MSTKTRKPQRLAKPKSWGPYGIAGLCRSEPDLAKLTEMLGLALADGTPRQKLNRCMEIVVGAVGQRHAAAA